MNEDCNLYEASQVQTAKVISPASEPMISKWQPKSYLWKFAALLAAVNAMIIYLCWQDGSWGVLGLLFVVGPSLNAILGVGSVIRTLFIKSSYPEFPLASYIFGSLALPVLAVVGDFLFVSTFVPVHGC